MFGLFALLIMYVMYPGFYGGSIGYNSKKNQAGYIELTDHMLPVTAPDELSSHLTIVLQDKVEEVIQQHVRDYSNMPLFLYYAMENGMLYVCLLKLSFSSPILFSCFFFLSDI
jgi:hypothetical protein